MAKIKLTNGQRDLRRTAFAVIAGADPRRGNARARVVSDIAAQLKLVPAINRSSHGERRTEIRFDARSAARSGGPGGNIHQCARSGKHWRSGLVLPLDG